MKKKRLTDDDLRADPDYQELCRLLDKQSAAQKARLQTALESQEEEDPMTERKFVDERITELKEDQGLSFAQIAEQLTREGYVNAAGGTFTANSVKSRYGRWKERGGREIQSPDVSAIMPSDSPEEDAASHGAPCEPCEASHDEIPAAWLAPLRKLIRDEFQAMTGNVARIETEKPPPTPRKKGSKEYEGERATLPGCRVDAVLHTLFEKERQAQGISASELMQWVLWAHFGKPRLSFEMSEASDSI